MKEEISEPEVAATPPQQQIQTESPKSEVAATTVEQKAETDVQKPDNKGNFI